MAARFLGRPIASLWGQELQPEAAKLQIYAGLNINMSGRGKFDLSLTYVALNLLNISQGQAHLSAFLTR